MFSLQLIYEVCFIFQVTLPLGYHEKCPVSVSLIARHGADRFLLDTVQTMYHSLQEQVDAVAKLKPSRNVVNQEQSAEMAKEKVSHHFSLVLSKY